MSTFSQWPDQQSFTVQEKDGITPSQWKTHPSKQPFHGSGGEMVAFPVTAKDNSGNQAPLVLKAYSVETTRYSDESVQIADGRPRRSPEFVEKLVARQWKGYYLLREANHKLVLLGLERFPLPPTVRLARSDEGEPAILMTDLSCGGNVILLEAKLVLNPRASNSELSRRCKPAGSWMTTEWWNNLRPLFAQQILRQIEMSKQVGVVFCHPLDVVESPNLYEHLSPWCVLVNRETGEHHWMIHDFMSVQSREEIGTDDSTDTTVATLKKWIV